MKNRLQSLDVLRGLIIALMMLVNNPGDWDHFYRLLLHAPWNGLTLADWVFPAFLWMVGVSIPLSLSKVENPWPRLLRRSLLIFLIGLALNAFPFGWVGTHHFEIGELRILGVLQRIALCYLITAALFIARPARVLILSALAFMAVYLVGMLWVPFSGRLADPFSESMNFAFFLDRVILGSHVWKVTRFWDPEGLWSTLPAVSTTILGVLCGQMIQWNKTSPLRKQVLFLGLGSILLAAGIALSPLIPINKSLWTPSYTLVTGGISILLFTLCYGLIDQCQWRRLAQPFSMMGMNALLVFILSSALGKLSLFIPMRKGDDSVIPLKRFVFESYFATHLPPLQASFLYACFVLMVLWTVAWFCHRKSWFLKI